MSEGRTDRFQRRTGITDQDRELLVRLPNEQVEARTFTFSTQYEDHAIFDVHAADSKGIKTKEALITAHAATEAAEKQKLLRMEFRTFVNTLIRVPCQIVKTGHRIVYRVLHWNESQPVFWRMAEVLQC